MLRARFAIGPALAFASLAAGCGGSDDEDDGTSKSPVSGEPRDAGTGASLSALIVTPVQPAVPFSGNTSAPHLHFHVMDGPSALTSEGVPYVIDTFTTRGRLRSTAVFDQYENTTTPFDIVPFAGDRDNRKQMPLDLTVVDFG